MIDFELFWLCSLFLFLENDQFAQPGAYKEQSWIESSAMWQSTTRRLMIFLTTEER